MQRDDTLAHYRVLHRLGAGGMGDVYAAEDTKLKRHVALKVLPPELADDPERRQRFEREAETIAALDHPNIVTIFSVEESAGRLFLTMQLVAGRTLGDAIPAGGMAVEDFFEIAAQVVSAVDAAHRKGVTHRDLKPANVMVSGEGRVTVLDFGLAKTGVSALGDAATELGGATRAQQLTRAGQIMGTVAYMSPEQAQGLQIDSRSDIFSLGSLFTEMLTAQTPFAGDNRSAIISAILKDAPRSVVDVRGDIPNHLGRILLRCLEKDPERRYQTAQDVANDLEDLQQELSRGTPALRHGPTATPDSPRRRRLSGRWLAAAAIIVGLVTVSLGGWEIWKRVASGAAAAAAATPPIDSIIALPAAVLAGPELSDLADTIPRILSRNLSRIEGVEVDMPLTAAEFEALGQDVDRVPAPSSGAAFVLPSITVVGSEVVSINVQLVEAGTKRLIWSSDFQGRRGDETELTRLAAEGIRSALGSAASPATSVAGLAVSSEAETKLRQGKYYTSRFDNLRMESDFDVALDAFETALRADQQLASAAADVAHLYIIRFETGDPEALQHAEAWIRRARTIAPRASDVWGALSFIEGRRATVDRPLRLQYALRAATLRPRDPRAHDFLGRALRELGYSSVLAMAAFRAAADLDWMYHQPRLRQATLLLQHGRTAEAQLLIDGVTRLEPEMPAASMAQGGRRRALARDAEEEVAPEPDELRRRAADGVSAGWEKRPILEAAAERARTGESELALELFSLLAADQVVLPYDTLLLGPAFEPLRREARFDAVVDTARQRFREMLGLLDEAAARGELPTYLSVSLADLEPRLGSVR